jgi:hypothetical protein
VQAPKYKPRHAARFNLLWSWQIFTHVTVDDAAGATNVYASCHLLEARCSQSEQRVLGYIDISAKAEGSLAERGFRHQRCGFLTISTPSIESGSRDVESVATGCLFRFFATVCSTAAVESCSWKSAINSCFISTYTPKAESAQSGEQYTSHVDGHCSNECARAACPASYTSNFSTFTVYFAAASYTWKATRREIAAT